MNADQSISIREYATDAIRWWELRRFAYNGVLAVVVLFYFVRYFAAAKRFVGLDGLLWLAMLAILANVVYCAAYPVDIFAQMSGYREQWKRLRWVLFAVGLTLAAILTRWFSMLTFAPGA